MTAMTGASRADRYENLSKLAADYRSLLPHERREAALHYLFEVAELLTLEADGDDIIAPLLDVIPFIADPAASPLFQDRRSVASAPSAAVLARAAVTIDVLMSMGHTAEGAGQIVARQLVNARAGLPSEGGDVRGWKRLLLWRERLLSLKKPAATWKVYGEFSKAVETAPRADVVRRAQDGTLWDIRKPAVSDSV
jgi:hypothetical protein